MFTETVVPPPSPHPRFPTQATALCSGTFTVSIMVTGLALALVMSLAAYNPGEDFWGQLGLLSIYILWIVLILTTLLCLLRKWLTRSPMHHALILTFLLLMVTIIGVNEATLFTLHHFALQNRIQISPNLRWSSLTIGAIIGGFLLRYTYILYQWQHKTAIATAARLEALQARIRPHFLFNSLNTIISLIHPHPQQAEESMLTLADLFRVSLRSDNLPIPLSEELEFVRQYLQMEKLRLGDRLQVKWQLQPQCAEVLIPPLTLQPLAENAVYHGIERSISGGEITISTHRNVQSITITITNPSPASPPAHGSNTGNRVAIDNIRQRLALRQPQAGQLLLQRELSQFHASVILPL